MNIVQETGYLFVRGLKQSLRPTAALLPSLIMPAFFLLVFTQGFASVGSQLAGGSYLVFYAPVAILQAIFFSSGDAGIDMVVDITSGYFDKLLIAPIHHVSIVVGKLFGVAVRAAVQAAIVMVILLLIGVHFATGPAGMLLILLLGALFGMAWSGIGITIALLTKNQRTTQSSFILFFPFTFITTAQLPLNQLHGWYRTLVELNPVTNVLEAIRTLATSGWHWDIISRGFWTALIVGVITVGMALLSFRRVVR